MKITANQCELRPFSQSSSNFSNVFPTIIIENIVNNEIA